MLQPIEHDCVLVGWMPLLCRDRLQMLESLCPTNRWRPVRTQCAFWYSQATGIQTSGLRAVHEHVLRTSCVRANNASCL